MRGEKKKREVKEDEAEPKRDFSSHINMRAWERTGYMHAPIFIYGILMEDMFG